jgi:hypothetical protein
MPTTTKAGARAVRVGVGRGRAKALTRPRDQMAQLLLQRVLATKGRIAGDFYELGELLVEVHDRASWRSYEGCTSFESFLHRYKIAGRTTAFKLMAIVRRFPREQALKQGMEFAYGMVRYCALVDELRNIGIDPKLIFGELDVEKLTVRDLAAINRRLLAALEGEDEEEVLPPLPEPPPRPPKTPLARNLQKLFRQRGAERAIVSSYVKDDVQWIYIKMPQTQWQLLGFG